MARHLGAHLCRCTGYVKILDAIEAVAQGKAPSRWACPAESAPAASEYEAAELALGDRGYVDDIRVPGLLHAALRLDRSRPGRRARGSTRRRRRGRARRGRRVHRRRRPRRALRVGLIHKDWPVIIPEGGRTSYAATCSPSWWPTTASRPRAAAQLVEVDYDVLRPLTDPVAAIDDPEIAVWGTDGNVLSRQRVPAGRRRRRPRRQRPRRARGVPDPAHRARLPRARVHRSPSRPSPPTAPALCTSTRAARGCGTTATTSPPCSASTPTRSPSSWSPTAAPSAARRTWPTRPRPRSRPGCSHRPVKCTLSREESLLIHPKRHPIRLEYWAGCDADGRLTGAAGPGHRRLRRLRQRRHEGARAGRRPRQRARTTCRPSTCESVAVRTNNPVCGAFRGFGANQAQFAMEGVLDRLAEQVGISGWEIRKRNVIRPGRRVGPGPDHGRRLPRRRAVPRRACARTYERRRRRGQGRRRRARAEELRPRQRLQGDRRGRRALRRRRQGRGAPLLDRDGPGRAHRRPAGGGRGARRRPGPHPGRSSTPPASSAPARPPAAGAR